MGAALLQAPPVFSRGIKWKNIERFSAKRKPSLRNGAPALSAGRSPCARRKRPWRFFALCAKQNASATHHVYAYVLRAGQRQRYSDDGEPQGTAGVPVLDVLLKSDVTDTAVVVTRYFGGILLGAGGLVRAYSHGASIALEAGGIVRMGACFQASLTCDYASYGKIPALIAEHGGAVDDTAFTENVTIKFHLPCAEAESFRTALADATCGSCAADFGTKKYYPVSP